MCVLCVEIAKKNMNIREIARAYRENDEVSSHLAEFRDELKKHYGKDVISKVNDELIKILREDKYGTV